MIWWRSCIGIQLGEIVFTAVLCDHSRVNGFANLLEAPGGAKHFTTIILCSLQGFTDIHLVVHCGLGRNDKKCETRNTHTQQAMMLAGSVCSKCRPRRLSASGLEIAQMLSFWTLRTPFMENCISFEKIILSALLFINWP